MQNAVIYARVSGSKQVTEGNGLESQIQRCNRHAEYKNYTVKKVFQDEGVSGKLQDRPAVRELLLYLAQNKGTIVLIDDIKRLARDVEVYLYLSKAINSFDCVIEYLNNNFDDSPESKFIELILAGSAQLEREQNARQVVQKMKSRLENGYYCFANPMGYTKVKKHLVRVEPTATIIKEMFEGFISRRFTSLFHCSQFLISNGIKADRHTARRLLTNQLYSGYFDFPKWEVRLTKAINIDPIISFEDWTKAQSLLSTPKRESRYDFYLRGYVVCSHCKNNLTAAYSTSKNGAKYGYYFCATRTCPLKGKNFSKSIIEGEFLNLLQSLEIDDPDFFELARLEWLGAVEGIKESWLMKQTELRDKVATIERDISNLVNRIAKTSSDTIAETLEKRINELEKEKIIILGKIKLSNEPDLVTAEQIYDQVINDFKCVSNTWQNSDTEGKNLIFWRVFEAKLVWDQKGMFRTPVLSLFYQQKRAFEGSNDLMVHYTQRLSNIIEAVKARLYTSEHTRG